MLSVSIQISLKAEANRHCSVGGNYHGKSVRVYLHQNTVHR